MLYLFIAVGLVFLAWLATAAFRGHDHTSPSWLTLKEQRATTLAALQAFLDSRPSKPENAENPLPVATHCGHSRCEEFYAALQRTTTAQALAIAEEAMTTESDSADARLLLSHALLVSADLEAAGAQHESAIKLGAKGGLATYLSARIEIAEYLQSAAEGSKASANSLLMPIELLALELHDRLAESGDVSALWLPGQGGEVSKEDAREFMFAHFTGYYRLAQTMIESLRTEPYADGIYLLGRLSLKCGFSSEGTALLLSIEEFMAESYQHKAYLRDMALLRGERQVATEASTSDGRKIIKLKVLN